MWGMLLATFSRDLIPALNSALWYRWMISYFCCHGFMDKNLMGLRGSNLRMSHAATYAIFRDQKVLGWAYRQVNTMFDRKKVNQVF